MASRDQVLIIDDDPFCRQALQAFLQKRGFTRFAQAGDGNEARQWSERLADELALILCDLNMPDFDGVEFLSDLADRGATCCPIVVISGADPTTAKAAVHLAKAYGLNLKGFIPKPIRFDHLAAIIDGLTPSINAGPKPVRG